MKKLIALLLVLMMVLSLAACGGGKEDPAEASTEAEPAGELTETARWSLRYDPEIWAWEDEEALDDDDYRSMFTIIIPDPEDEEDELVWFRINAMEVDHENFRSNLRRDGFDQYEYAVNNAYETVNVGGLDFLLDDTGGLWCLEANSLPGMTPTSLFPQEAAAVGMSYPDLCETIVLESIKARKAERK